MKVRVAVVCHDRLLSGRIEKLVLEDPDLRLLPPVAPPFVAREIAGLRCDVLLVDRSVLSALMKELPKAEKPLARLILLAGETTSGKATLSDKEKADLVTRGVVAGIVPADVKGRLLKKAVKAVASGEFWLAARSEG